MKSTFTKKYIIFLLLIFVIFAGFIFVNNNKTSQNQKTIQAPVANKTYETLSDDKNGISVETTPKSLSSKENVVFDVAINNHQVDLTYDLAKIAVLTDDKGNKYAPVSWSGPEGGHHSVGVLVFPPLSKDAKSINLLFPKVEGADRSFTWKL